MNEGADSVIAQICGDSHATLVEEGEREGDATTATTATQPSPSQPPSPPPPSTTYTGRRRPRCGTGGPPPSPYMWIDGRQLRSALVWAKKPSEGNDPSRRVSFPTSDSHLVTGYLEPANPWRHAENVSRDDLIFAYKESCARHNTEPLQNVLAQLEHLDVSEDRCEELNLEGENLDQDHCEPLEEILKRVQFNKINLEGTFLDDESSIILFDMLEYYESARHLNISSNPNIGPRGWQACSHMIKKTQCLEQLEAKDITLNEQYMNILSRALRLVCHLHVLKLENCGLSGRAIVILVTALKMNSGIRELYLADNGLDLYDAIQLGSLLRMNNHLQLLDISNNNVQDDGVRDILEGLINQVNEDKTGKGLSILILWNNRLTQKSSPFFSRILTLSQTLETLNIGQNMLTDETLNIVNESLKKNRVLLQLGMQSTELTCDGMIRLAEIMEANQVLQRIDLRDNSIQMRGMHALVNVMKKNKSITQIDLDDKPRIRIDGPLHQYMDLIAEIRNYCTQNEKRRLLEGSAEDAGSLQHPNRLLNASSRKISLTCQTLPSPSRSALAAGDESATRAMLEPKRTSGGRLRSPAPSPIPSPVASPIPSPSRNRFVVCRVPEASLRSADSSASSSPVNPPSLGSSPTCIFSGTSSGSSRFRVSVVEPVGSSCSLSTRSVVTASPSGNVTIGFNFKSVDSSDSGSAIKTGTATQDVDKDAAASIDTFNVIPVASETSSSHEAVAENKNCDEETKNKEARLEDNVETQSEKDKDATTMTQEGPCDQMVNRSNVAMDLENVATTGENIETFEVPRIMYMSAKELQVPAYPSEDTASARISIIEDKAVNSATESSSDDTAAESSKNSTSETFSSSVLVSSATATLGTSSICTTHPQERTNTSVQKHKSSLEKLLSLFQYPGNLFSDSSSAAVDTRSSLQENMSGVMTLGDKLQQYLKESRAKVSTDSSWFSEHGLPSKNKSVRLNVSQLQNLTGIFASFKLDPHTTNLVEQGTKFFSQAKNQGANISEKDLQRPPETDDARNYEENLSCQEKNQVTGNDGKCSVSQEKNQIARNDGNDLFDQEGNEITRNNEEDCVNQESNRRVVDDEEELIEEEEEENRVTRKDESNLIDQEKNQIMRDGENNLFDQEQDQITRNGEKNLIVKKNNQITRNGETNLLGQESQVARRDEQSLFDQVSKNNEKDLIGQDLNDENNLYEKEQIARDIDENFQVQEKNVVEDAEDLLNRRENEIVSNDEIDLKDQTKVAEERNEDLEDPEKNRVGINDGKDSTGVRDAFVNAEENACSVYKLKWTESDRDDRPLPENVQSKDKFADKDIVLEDNCAAMTNAAALSSPAYKFTCVAIKLTDIPEYSVLELSQANDVGCNDAKRSAFSDDEDRRERDDDAQDFERIEHNNNNTERLQRDDSQLNTERDEQEVLKGDVTKISESNDAKCLERDDEFEEINARRTCDTTTTDSINQTSDSSFPICNIARDRKIIDSVSTAGVSMDTHAMSDDVGTTTSLPDNGGTMSTSFDEIRARNVDESDYLNDEVTSRTHRIAADHQCYFMRRKEEEKEEEEDRAGVFDDVCRDSAHCKSTSINIKVELPITESTSPVSGNRDASNSTERLCERQLSVPNSVDVHRIILKDAAETEEHLEDVVDDIDKRIDPTILVTPYDTSADKSDVEELIFCMTDISTDGTSVEDELSPVMGSRCLPNDVVKATDSYFELPTSTTPTTPTTPTTTTLLIDNPDVAHRNSQDSGIDETALSIDDAVTVDAHPLPPTRGSLQESVDSGIESECSSICVRVESAAERTLETAATTKKLPRDDNGDMGDNEDDGDNGDDGGDGNDYLDGEFASDFLAKEARLVDNDSMNDIARSYLNSIKCAVVSTARPVASMASGAPLGVVVADEDIARPAATVITHSPAAVHGTSPK